MYFTKRFLEDLDIVAVRTTRNDALCPGPRAKVWLPPSDNAAKLNCDGGVSSLGERGVAVAVCQDSTGKY